VIRDYLLPLGLDTNHGYGKTPVPNSESSKKRAALEKRLNDIKQWAPAARERSSKAERNRLQAEAEREMQESWQRVSHVLETSNKEFAKWERYCCEQGDLLRALENLAAQERTMYELDNRKDQIMTGGLASSYSISAAAQCLTPCQYGSTVYT
jgi:hypothetical protein